jgi:hypothetical protein
MTTLTQSKIEDSLSWTSMVEAHIKCYSVSFHTLLKVSYALVLKYVQNCEFYAFCA